MREILPFYGGELVLKDYRGLVEGLGGAVGLVHLLCYCLGPLVLP